MRLKDYAKKQGICYKTAYNWWRAGYLKGVQMPTGTIIIDENSEKQTKKDDRDCGRDKRIK